MTDKLEATYKLRFFFDYQCESCLWCDNDEAYKKYDVGPIDETFYDINGKVAREPKINLPTELREKVIYLSKLFDSSLNWDNPKEPEPTWTSEKQKEFDFKSKELHKEVCKFLGQDYEVIYKH
jgi:hypothetical protein